MPPRRIGPRSCTWSVRCTLMVRRLAFPPEQGFVFLNWAILIPVYTSHVTQLWYQSLKNDRITLSINFNQRERMC